MSMRNHSPLSSYPHPDQIGRPNISPASPYLSQYPQQQVPPHRIATQQPPNPVHGVNPSAIHGVNQPNIGNVGTHGGSLLIDITTNELLNSSSLEYSTPVHFSPILTNFHNPELEDEFNLLNLGIDLQTSRPLLPNISYAGSDNPMINFGQFPVPHSYPRTPENNNEMNRITQFSNELLLFIFYIHARDKLQQLAYEELQKRGFSYDQVKKVWINPSKLIFDLDKWSFVSPETFIPIS